MHVVRTCCILELELGGWYRSAVAACDWNQLGSRVQQLVQLRATPGACGFCYIFNSLRCLTEWFLTLQSLITLTDLKDSQSKQCSSFPKAFVEDLYNVKTFQRVVVMTNCVLPNFFKKSQISNLPGAVANEKLHSQQRMLSASWGQWKIVVVGIRISLQVWAINNYFEKCWTVVEQCSHLQLWLDVTRKQPCKVRKNWCDMATELEEKRDILCFMLSCGANFIPPYLLILALPIMSSNSHLKCWPWWVWADFQSVVCHCLTM